MKATVSPSTSLRYSLTMICQVWRVAGLESLRGGPAGGRPGAGQARAKAPGVSDADLVAAIRGILRQTPFHGEGIGRCGHGWPIVAWPWAASGSCG